MDRYYFIQTTPTDLANLVSTLSKEVIDCFCQDLSTVRFNLAEDECVLSLKQSVKIVPDILKDSTPVSTEEARIKVRSLSWLKPLD